MKKLPRDLKEKLKKQETHLDLKVTTEAETNKIISRIVKQINKTTNDVLINKSTSHRAKQEIHEIIDRKKQSREIHGNHSWMMGLRKPNDYNGVHYGLINVGNMSNPIWQAVKETYPIPEVEIIRKPNLELTEDLKNMTNNSSFLKTISSFKINIDEMEEIEKLNVRIFIY